MTGHATSPSTTRIEEMFPRQVSPDARSTANSRQQMTPRNSRRVVRRPICYSKRASGEFGWLSMVPASGEYRRINSSGVRPEKSLKSRIICAWSLYPHSAATTEKSTTFWEPISVNARRNRKTRPRTFGGIPISSRKLLTIRLRVQPSRSAML
jgi:hypothetical protein